MLQVSRLHFNNWKFVNILRVEKSEMKFEMISIGSIALFDGRK